ncbi:DUF1398 family protein, partial [Escherichia coli]
RAYCLKTQPATGETYPKSDLFNKAETTSNKLKSREITFQEYRRNLAKAGVFRWVTNIHEQKRYYYTFDNSLLFTESIQKTTQILPR